MEDVGDSGLQVAALRPRLECWPVEAVSFCAIMRPRNKPHLDRAGLDGAGPGQTTSRFGAVLMWVE